MTDTGGVYSSAAVGKGEAYCKVGTPYRPNLFFFVKINEQIKE